MPPELLHTMREGDHHDQVTYLQHWLYGVGHDPGRYDGYFDAATAEAVRAFQTAQHLADDGIVGPKTWGALSHFPDPTTYTPPAPAAETPVAEPAVVGTATSHDGSAESHYVLRTDKQAHDHRKDMVHAAKGHVPTGAARPSSQKLVDLCKSLIGKAEYWYGHEGEDHDGDGRIEFDCSGMIEWACLELGVYVPRTGAVAYCHEHGGRISPEEARGLPGVIVTSGKHVGLTVGDGEHTVEAVNPAEDICLKKWRPGKWVDGGLIPGFKYPGRD